VTVTGGAINVDTGAVLNCFSFLTNSTPININPGTTAAGINLSGGAGTFNLSGGGTILLSNTGGGVATVSGSGIVVTDHVVRGAGQYGINSFSVFSNAPVEADVAGQAITVDPAGTTIGFTNNNVLRASNGALLVLSGNGGGAFNNGGAGTILAANASEVRFINSATVNGGTLASSGSGFFRLPAGHAANWSGLTLSGVMNLESGSTLNVSPSLLNTGAINVAADVSPAVLNLNNSGGTFTLSGGGTVTLSSTGSGLPTFQGSGTIVSDNLIQGFGQVGSNLISIVNNALIDANLPGATMTIDPAGTTTGFTNNNLLRSGGEILTLSGNGGGAFNNNGTILATATPGGEIRFINSAVLNGGTLIASAPSVSRILTGHTITFNNVNSSGTILIEPGSTLNVGSLLLNSSAINVSAGASSAFLNMSSSAGTTTLSGGGTILMSSTGAGAANVSGSGTLVSDHPIQGFGLLGNNVLSIIQNAPVDANVSSQTMTVDPAGTPVGYTSNSILRATNGALMILTGNGGGAFNNGTIGSVLAGNGSEVRLLNGAVINGGTLATAGSGFYRLPAGHTATYNGVTSTGSLVIESGSTLSFSPFLTNTGTINVNAGASSSFFNVAGGGTVLLNGGGTINLSSTGAGAAMIQGSGTLVSDNTINGFGGIGANVISIINNGPINVGGGTLTIDPAGTTLGFVNNALLRIASDGTAVLTGNGGGAFGGTGSVSVDGTLRATNSANATTGNVAGAGTIIVESNARLTANHVRVGTVSVGANSTLTINTNGGNAGTSRIVANPSITGGRFDLNDNDLIITAGDVATVRGQIVAARHSGAWDTPGLTSSAARTQPNHATTLGLLSGAEYISVAGTSFDGFTVAASDVLVKYTWYGDADFNGRVNFDDYVRIDNGFNNHFTGWLNGDFDLNGVINFDDYVLIDLAFNTQSGTLRRAMSFLDGSDRASDVNGPALRAVERNFQQFGPGYADHFLAAVPEPTSAAVIFAALVAPLCRRRRRQFLFH
jgi:hypothetical protein